jgi:hypothetical protein
MFTLTMIKAKCSVAALSDVVFDICLTSFICCARQVLFYY